MKLFFILILFSTTCFSQGVTYPRTTIENGITVVSYSEDQVDYMLEKKIRCEAKDTTERITQRQLDSCKALTTTYKKTILMMADQIDRKDTTINGLSIQLKKVNLIAGNCATVLSNKDQQIRGLKAKVIGFRIGTFVAVGGVLALFLYLK